jgi:2-polyprenyl-3-methyl-5-hydroxy-6-metoxy-1,4-benzoquinol methylase
MAIGKIARKVLGKKFYTIGCFYRSIFVDLGKVADAISPFIPHNAVVLDIGGGDGEPLNFLLSRRNDIKVKIIDQKQNIGKFITAEYLQRVELFPGMGIEEFFINTNQKINVIIISDVIHHIPSIERKAFFTELKTSLIDKYDSMTIIIKDIEPGYFRSFLSLFSDRYISGDKGVSLIDWRSLTKMMNDIFGGAIVIKQTALFTKDRPNYAIVYIC